MIEPKRCFLLAWAVVVGCSDAPGASPPDAGTTGDSSSPSDAATADAPQAPPPKLGACDGLAPSGTWEDVTPPEVKAGFGKVKDGGGTFAFAIDPVNQGTVYLGTLYQKVWKSVDCGATWTHVATGKNGAVVDSGMNWTFAVDPIEPNVIYTNSGYGGNGLFKSKNGGVDWDVVWPPPGQPALGKAFTYNFANVVALDPNDHLHILLTFHESCLAPHPATCIAETKDGGDTWKLIDGEPSWNGNEGQVIFFLEDSTIWLWGSQTNGFWRGTGSGASWQAIPKFTTSHLQGSQLYRTKTGAFFVAGSDGVWKSSDGKVANWKLIPNTGPIMGGLVSDGTTMYTSNCYFGGYCQQAKYFRAPEADDEKWTEMPSPKIPMGGSMAYDKGHHVLYSSNMQSGFWRVVLP